VNGFLAIGVLEGPGTDMRSDTTSGHQLPP